MNPTLFDQDAKAEDDIFGGRPHRLPLRLELQQRARRGLIYRSPKAFQCTECAAKAKGCPSADGGLEADFRPVQPGSRSNCRLARLSTMVPSLEGEPRLRLCVETRTER